MGGRGSFSATHGGIAGSIDGGGSLYVSKVPESREDIRQLFINELGFKELYGTNAIPTAQLAALGIELKNHERSYNTLRDNEVYLSITNQPGVKGAASYTRDGSMMMFLNPNVHSNVGNYRKELRSEQASGFKTKTDRKVTSDFTYTARHEYGHLTQFSISKKTGKSANTIKNEVQGIAEKNYNVKRKSPSQYGAKNDYEYFAESFASMTGGRPNAQGKALKKWLNNK